MAGVTAARGYGREHQRLRAWWQVQIDAGGVRCSRPECPFPGRVVLPGMLWDLDHSDDRSGYLGPAHRRCNRAAGARKGNRARSVSRRVPYVW
jgi:hypothetical protein